MRLLVTGAAGMLGSDVIAAARAAGHEATGLSRAQLDVTDARAVRAAVAQAGSDVVINCAAWTDVDGAEDHEDGATRVNGGGAGNVAAAAANAGAATVQVSSDYVFDGSKREPYVESDATAPLSAYGRSKLAGEEEAAAAAGARHAIVRSSWLFGAAGRNFVATMLGLSERRDEVMVVDDQVGCPTYTGHLASALIELAARAAADDAQGIYHVAGAGDCSWYDFAVEIFAQAGIDCAVRRGSTAELARPAPRPAHSVLGSERGAPALPDWREGLAAYLAATGAARAASETR